MKTPPSIAPDPQVARGKSALGRVLSAWTPQDAAKAKTMLEEFVARANVLSGILAEYTWHSSCAEVEGGQFVLELLDDLLSMGYSMIEWWDPEEQEGQP